MILFSNNSITEGYGNKGIFVPWKFKDNGKGKKQGKIPCQLNGKPGSSTDPEMHYTLSEIRQVEEATAKHFAGLGVVFSPATNLVGVDLDGVIVDNVITNPHIAELVATAKTYTEYSPSKTGLHLYFDTDKPFTPDKNKTPAKLRDTYGEAEVYSDGRFFTLTGDSFGEALPVKKVTHGELNTILSAMGYPWDTPKDEAPINATTQAGCLTNKEDILNVMFRAKNGEEVKALYNGSIAGYDDDYSSAEMALCSHIAFYTGRNPQLIKDIWLTSPLGQRKKTQERGDYVDRTITNCVDNISKTFTPRTDPEDAEEYMMSSGKNPEPLQNLVNHVLALKKLGGVMDNVRYNDFNKMVECQEAEGVWKPLQDSFILSTQYKLQSTNKYFSAVSNMRVTEAIMYIAKSTKTVNPPQEYFKSLVWDGKPRLDRWLISAFHTPDDEVHRSMGSNWLKGLVKRVMYPGCQFDEMLVLEGKQGTRKSTALRVIGSPWHVEINQTPDNKDFMLTLVRNMIVEFSEGDIMSRAGVNKLKGILTQPSDQVRPPYEKGIIDIARNCVFAMTTNDAGYLKDDTGNRRFLTVATNGIAEIDWLEDNRDQLYAEAYNRVVNLKETTYEYPDELEELQDMRQEQNEYFDSIANWFCNTLSQAQRDDGVTVLQAYAEITQSDREMDRRAQMQYAGMFQGSLYLEKSRRKINGMQATRWFATDKTDKYFKYNGASSNDVIDFEEEVKNF